MRVDQDTVVVVTGASRGIGRAAVLEFAAHGARVVAGARDMDRLTKLSEEASQQGLEVVPWKCDVASETDCRGLIHETLRRFGRIDVLVNNAGIGCYAPIPALTVHDLDRIFRTNLYGTIWCTQAALEEMRKKRRGHIVNVSTIISRRAIPLMSAYCMTKFAMNAFDEALRVEMKRQGIGVSLVCPGLTDTDFQTNSIRAGAEPPVRNRGGMPSEKVARAIVGAVERNRRNVYLTTSGKVLVALQKLSPRLCDFVLDRYMQRATT